jgi:hypothetical protein
VIKVERLPSGKWTATLCWLHGSMKIFADSREEAIRKSQPFSRKAVSTIEPVLDQTTMQHLPAPRAEGNRNEQQQ